MKLVALDPTGNPVMQFEDSTEAGIWAKLPAQDIDTAQKNGDSLYGYKYASRKDLIANCPRWADMSSQELSTDAVYAIALLSNIDKDGMVYDKLISQMLSAEEIYDRYWEPCSVRDLFEAIKSSADRKHAILDGVDQEKKEIHQLIIGQPKTDKQGTDCVYVPTEDVVPVLEQLCKESGVDGDVKYEGGECYLGKHNGIRYFAVKETVQPFTLDDWKGDKA